MSESQPDGGPLAADARRARFEDLYARVHADLQRYCLRRVWPAEDAEDLMAEVLAVVWRRLEDVPAAPGDRPYVFAIARNLVRDRRRRNARRDRIFQLAAAQEQRDTETAWATAHPGAAPAGDDSGRDARELDALRDAFARLSDDDAEVLRLAIWEELSHREIATVLGVRENTVTVRLHRARRRLRRHLEQVQQAGQPATDHSLRTAGEGTPAPGPWTTRPSHSRGGTR